VALVAEDEGRVVGFLDREFRTRLNFTAPQARIPDLVVADGARGRGIGGRLLAGAEEIARARGCWSMVLEFATWRERAHAFYVSQGWEETGRAFTRLLARCTGRRRHAPESASSERHAVETRVGPWPAGYRAASWCGPGCAGPWGRPAR